MTRFCLTPRWYQWTLRQAGGWGQDLGVTAGKANLLSARPAWTDEHWVPGPVSWSRVVTKECLCALNH